MLIREWMRSSLCRRIGRTLRVLCVVVTAFDDLLLLVLAQHFERGEPAGLVGRQRVDAVGLGRGGDRVLVALPGEGWFAVPGDGTDGQ